MGESPKICLDTTLGIATVRKLASKQPLGLEALLVTISELHSGTFLFQFYFGTEWNMRST